MSLLSVSLVKDGVRRFAPSPWDLLTDLVEIVSLITDAAMPFSELPIPTSSRRSLATEAAQLLSSKKAPRHVDEMWIFQ